MKTPFCITCGKTMVKIDIGKAVAFFTRALGNKMPYEVWSADIHECPSCKHKVAAQYADEPFWRHFHDEPVPQVDYAVWEK